MGIYGTGQHMKEICRFSGQQWSWSLSQPAVGEREAHSLHSSPVLPRAHTPFTHSHIHMGKTESSFHVSWMFLGCRRKLDCPEETHMNILCASQSLGCILRRLHF
ncbi:hypothetical protein GJAV_G00134620 [Gymnothorax javanicus]|nr:hypothetical protein GJAV_G00134620 [Gymnothorax javanicus]